MLRPLGRVLLPSPTDECAVRYIYAVMALAAVFNFRGVVWCGVVWCGGCCASFFGSASGPMNGTVCTFFLASVGVVRLQSLPASRTLLFSRSIAGCICSTALPCTAPYVLSFIRSTYGSHPSTFGLADITYIRPMTGHDANRWDRVSATERPVDGGEGEGQGRPNRRQGW